jgi:gluconokinase
LLLVTGVSGSGKTTVGAMLAGRLHCAYAEADGFHPAANVAKMRAGIPLDDEDRRPWLRAIAAWIDERAAAGESAVVTCSALKRQYRDFLRRGRPQVRLIYLDGDEELIAGRLASRHGHFFPARLLDSQFRDLEPPQPDEHPLTVRAADPPGRIVAEILATLGLTPRAPG